MTAEPDFESWVTARGPALLRLAFVVSGDAAEAEDLVQEALSRAYPRWRRISAMEHPEAYVRRIILNTHTSWWRRRRRERPVPQLPERGVEASVGDELGLWRASLELPRDQRVALVLRYYEGLEYAEIAALTGVREGSVRSRVSRGLAALRAALAESEMEVHDG
ncbi:SigE family RNA polymerase sigma factor [Nocardioides sp.]|uniref:SigE family RNA polymerase sigma factor n=1 Tax=Nocardioides sp. TaxID=35761 RepID=UPI003528F903